MRKHLLAVSPEAIVLARDGDKLEAILTAADGRIGEALRLLKEKTRGELFRRRELVSELILAIVSGRSYGSLLSALSALPTKRAELSELFPMILDAMRDLCAIRRAPDAPLLFFSERERARELAGKTDYARLYRIESAIREAQGDLALNANVQTVITSLAQIILKRA